MFIFLPCRKISLSSRSTDPDSKPDSNMTMENSTSTMKEHKKKEAG